MEQMVSHIIYEKHIREKSHQANSHKQEPKGNHKGKLKLVWAHMPHRKDNL